MTIPIHPGLRHRHAVKVANVRTDREQEFIVSVVGWELTSGGDLRLLPPSPMDPTNWVRVAPLRFKLGPGVATSVNVELAVPFSHVGNGEVRVALLISNPPPSKEWMERINGVVNRIQLASLMYLVPKGAIADPVVRDEEVIEGTGRPALRLTVENRGNAHARLEGRLRVFDGDTLLAESTSQLVLMDGQVRRFLLDTKSEDPPNRPLKVIASLRRVRDWTDESQDSSPALMTKQWQWTPDASSR